MYKIKLDPIGYSGSMTTILETCPHVQSCRTAFATIKRWTNNAPIRLVGSNGLNLDSIEWVDSKINAIDHVRFRVNKDGTMGYFKPKSHTLVPIDHCSIADESINAALKGLGTVPSAKTIEFRSNGTNVIANVSSLKGKRPTKDVLQTWAEGTLNGIGLDGHKMWGGCKTELEVCEFPIFSLASFYQVNQGINALLVETVRDWVLEHNYASPGSLLRRWKYWGSHCT